MIKKDKRDSMLTDFFDEPLSSKTLTEEDKSTLYSSLFLDESSSTPVDKSEVQSEISALNVEKHPLDVVMEKSEIIEESQSSKSNKFTNKGSSKKLYICKHNIIRASIINHKDSTKSLINQTSKYVKFYCFIGIGFPKVISRTGEKEKGRKE